MKDAHLKTTRKMFYNLIRLKEIQNIENLVTDEVTDMEEMFASCVDLLSLDLSKFNTAQVTNMRKMFASCSDLQSLDLSRFNTANVTNMEEMFLLSGMTTLDLSSFNTSNVTNMKGMFDMCEKLRYLDLNSFDISHVQDVTFMFNRCRKLTTIHCEQDWSGYNPEGKESMFEWCTLLFGEKGTACDGNHYDENTHNLGILFARLDGLDGKPGYFSTANPTLPSIVYTEYKRDDEILTYYYDNKYGYREGTVEKYIPWNRRFEDYHKHIRTVKIDASMKDAHLTSTRLMFSEKLPGTVYADFPLKNLTEIQGIENLVTDEVTDMADMFSGCSSLKKMDLRTFNTANVTDMGGMFFECSSLETLDVSKFNTSNVTDMGDMFRGCTSLKTVDVSQFNTSNVTTFSLMFYECSSLKSLDLSNFNAPNATSMYGMFQGCSSLKSLDLGQFNSSGITNMTAMFRNCSSLESVNLKGSFNTSNVTSMEEMFLNCTSLKSLDLSQFNTSNVKSMYRMFLGCSSLQSIDLSSFNTSNVTNMEEMFVTCKSLKSLDLRTFNTFNVTDMEKMFGGCFSLTAILSSDDWSKGVRKNSREMFVGCSKLKGGRGTKCDGKSNIDATYAHPDGLNGQEGYFTAVVEAYTLYDEDNGRLTYYYDGLRSTHGGVIEFCPLTPDEQTVRFADYADKVKKVIITPSFKNAPITTLSRLFNGGSMETYLSALETIEGLENINYSEVTSLDGMFMGCASLQSINLSPLYAADNVESMQNMFNGCASLEAIDLYPLNTANVTSMEGLFKGCSSLKKLDLSPFNTAKVETMYSMFSGCSALQSLDVRSFNTENVEYMSFMFNGCTNLKSLDLRDFSIAKLREADCMFNGCTGLTTIFCFGDWSESLVLGEAVDMFKGCIWLVGGEGTQCDGNSNIDKSYAHPDLGTGHPGYFTTVMEVYTAFDAATGTLTYYCDEERLNRTDMITELYDPYDYKTVRFKEYGPDVLEAVIDESMRKANLTSMHNMFFGGGEYDENSVYVRYPLANMKEIEGLENFVTDRVTDMGGMFYGCTSLKELDLTRFDVGNVKKMKSMFGNCESLKTIRSDKDWSTSKAESDNMFLNCRSLAGRMGTVCDGANATDKRYARPDGGENASGYFTQSVQPVKRGGFTIDDEGTMVEFAPGNLQFNAAKGTHLCADGTTQKGTWRFAPHQWTRAGESNTHIAEDYEGWIDLFGWGTSGWNSGATAYQPWSSSNSYADYLNEHLQWENKYADWGVYNQIGDDAPETWRTLSSSEWDYLLTKRSFADNLRGQATVNGVRGFVLLPDTWETPDCISFTWGNSIGWNENVYDGEVWDKMEAAGAIFFPAAGYRDGNKLIGEDIYGYYWSTVKSNISQAYYFYFMSNTASRSAGSYNSYGRSVRLVKPYINEPDISSDYQTPQDKQMTVTIYADPNAAIWYKVFISDKMYDGTDPYTQDWQQYTEPFEVKPGTDFGETKYVTVLAYSKTEDTESWGEVIKGQRSDVAVAEYTFFLHKIPEKPVISTDYQSAQDESLLVTINAEDDATIMYKYIVTDNQPATESEYRNVPWQKYLGAFYVFPNTDYGQTKYVTIRAYTSDHFNSEIASEVLMFTKVMPPAAPVITSDYETPEDKTIKVTITADKSTKVWYRTVTDGEDDDASWSEYTAPFMVTPNFGERDITTVTILTYAEKDGVKSDVEAEVYMFTQPDKELETLPADEETTFDFTLYNPAGSELLDVTLGAKDNFNKEEGRMEVTTTNTEAEIDEKLNAAFAGTSSLRSLLPGTITFKLSAGHGQIEIDCQTTPGYILKVRIAEYGTAFISSTIEQAARGKATVNYSVKQDTYVVIYLEGTSAGSAPARIAASAEEEDAGAYIYSIKIIPDRTPTGIEDAAGGSEGVRKVLINGNLYILRDGRIYNATGQLIIDN